MGRKWDNEKFSKYGKYSSIQVYTYNRHHLQPNVNGFPSENPINLEDFKSFPWYSTYPEVFLITPEINTFNQVDKCLKLVKDKRRYVNQIKSLKIQYKRRKNKLSKLGKASRSGRYLMHVAHMAELLKKDPDKYFSGLHNWYFTGGTLDCLADDKGMSLFSAFGSHLNGLRVTREARKGKSRTIKSESLFLPHEEEIHQVSVVPMSSDDLRVLVRQRRNVSLLHLRECFDPDRGINITSPEVPFVFALLDKDDANFIYTIDAENNLREWDIRTNPPVESSSVNLAPTNKFKRKKKTSNWATILALNEDFLIYANQHEVKMIEKEILKVQLTFNLDEYVQECAEICCIALSKFSNVIYIARSHDCFAVSFDLSNKEYTVQLRWTHQLTIHPAFMRTCLVAENTELIAISSTTNGDMRIMLNDRELAPQGEDEEQPVRYIYKSPCLPYKLRTFEELYYLTRLHGECLDPTIPLHKRINFSTCGIDIHVNPINGEIRILTINSVGDIFSQILCGSNIPPPTDTLVNLSQNIRMNPEDEKYNITGRSNLKSLDRVFSCRQFNQPVGVEDEKEALKRRPRWRKSIKHLKKYTDMLAQELLAVWEMDDEEEEEEKILNDPLDVSTVSALDKVGDWLNSIHQQKEPQEQTEQQDQQQSTSTFMIQEVEEDTKPMISMEVDDYKTPDITREEEFLLQTPREAPLTQPSWVTPKVETQKKTAKAKKKSHVIGF